MEKSSKNETKLDKKKERQKYTETGEINIVDIQETTTNDSIKIHYTRANLSPLLQNIRYTH